MRTLLLILLVAFPAASHELWDLLKANQFDRANSLLGKNFYVDTEHAGFSAIHLAARAGNLEAVKFLIDHGADVDDPDAHKLTPLMHAVDRGHLAMAQYLVEHGASLDAVSDDPRTPLMFAVDSHSDSVVEYLLKKSADPLFQPASDGHSNPSNALFLSVAVRDSAIFERLFAVHPDPNLQLRDGRTLLMAAADANSPMFVRRLLSMHADNSRLDQRGNSALHHACMAGVDTSILVQLLLDGADPNAGNVNRQTPLHLAVASRKVANVRVLLRGKINIDLQDLSGNTPCTKAMEMGLEEIAHLLRDKGASPLVPSTHHNASRLVVSSRSPLLAKLLIIAGADVNGEVYPYLNGWKYRHERILTIAASKGWNEVIDLAVAKGADPNLANGEQRNPLQCAMKSRQYGAFQLLLKRGARVDSVFSGEYLRWLVASEDSSNGISILLKSGADVNDRDLSGRTPLMIAAKGNQAMNLKVLLKAKADPTLRDGRGRTALHEAIESDCFECAKLLVEKGASVKDAFVNARDSNGRTPLMINCANSGSMQTRELLEKNGAKLKLRDNTGISAEQYCTSSEGE